VAVPISFGGWGKRLCLRGPAQADDREKMALAVDPGNSMIWLHEQLWKQAGGNRLADWVAAAHAAIQTCWTANSVDGPCIVFKIVLPALACSICRAAAGSAGPWARRLAPGLQSTFNSS